MYDGPSATGRRLVVPIGANLRAVQGGDAWILRQSAGAEPAIEAHAISGLPESGGRGLCR
jgi:hypothetical protein